MTSISTIGTGLTHKVRSLVVIIIIIIMLLCYITCGSLVQTFMLDITFVNTLHFSVVSIETIGEHETLGDTNFIVSFYLFAVNTGFGDIRPTNTGSRIFVSLYISGGILNLTLAVAFS